MLLQNRNKGPNPALTAPCQVMGTFALPATKCLFQMLNASEKERL